MSWWKNKNLDLNDNTYKIIKELVINCPASTVKKEKDGVYQSGNNRYKRNYIPVSARNCSFRNRGITGNLLTTIMSKARRNMQKMQTFKVINTDESVENVIQTMIAGSSYSDPYFEIVVFRKQNDISDAETFFYYIRNAFAHGSFEIIEGENPTYILESQKNGTVKARMRIKESTLLEYVDLVQKKPSEIRAMQKKKTK